MDFNDIDEAIRDFRKGKFVIVVDDEDRENEGDLIVAADKITPDKVNFITKKARGLICVAITEDRARELGLELMVEVNNRKPNPAFTVSVDYLIGSSSGISAHDRSKTIRALANPEVRPRDFRSPVYTFPLISNKGGVLQRAGHTEAAVDLAKLSGLHPSGVLCEIMDEDGTMARRDRLIEMSGSWDMKIITIKDLIKYQR